MIALRVGGVQVGTPNPATLGYATDQRDLTIGAYDVQASSSFGFIGSIDEVRLTDRVLTPAEIQARAGR